VLRGYTSWRPLQTAESPVTLASDLHRQPAAAPARDRFGAALGGLAWNFGAWPACVALVALMLAAIAAVVGLAWSRAPQAAPVE